MAMFAEPDMSGGAIGAFAEDLLVAGPVSVSGWATH
jgi:hypothetical protein